MGRCQQLRFILLLIFLWIYCADTCEVTVTQPKSMEVYIPSSSIVIQCTFSTKGCPRSTPTFLWFRYLSKRHENLCIPECTNSRKFKSNFSVERGNISLQINNIEVKDSAIYICGIAFQDSKSRMSKQTGSGTVLVIKDHNQGVQNTLLAALSLLLLYLLALATIMKFFSEPKSKETGRGDPKEKGAFNKSRRAVSQAIAKEFCKKKYNRKNQHVKKGSN